MTNRQGVTPPSTDRHQDCHALPSSSQEWSVGLEEIPKVLCEVCKIRLVSDYLAMTTGLNTKQSIRKMQVFFPHSVQ